MHIQTNLSSLFLLEIFCLHHYSYINNFWPMLMNLLMERQETIIFRFCIDKYNSANTIPILSKPPPLNYVCPYIDMLIMSQSPDNVLSCHSPLIMSCHVTVP